MIAIKKSVSMNKKIAAKYIAIALLRPWSRVHISASTASNQSWSCSTACPATLYTTACHNGYRPRLGYTLVQMMPPWLMLQPAV
jgi:hypothetical protein